MCSHYQAPHPDRLKQFFAVEQPKNISRSDIWPGYESAFIRSHPHSGEGDEAVPAKEACRGVFGLVPHWSKDLKLSKRTFNARSETASQKPSFRDAWKWGKHCVIPADAIYEPDWRSGKAIPTRITRADGAPMGIAGLWASWKSPQGDEVLSFTMLTINADNHSIMRNFHKPEDEKRMVVILPTGAYEDWLFAEPGASMEFMQQYPADRLVATPQPMIGTSA